MTHIEVNWIEDGQEKVLRDIRPLAFRATQNNILFIYDTLREYYEHNPSRVFNNVTRIAYWDDALSCKA